MAEETKSHPISQCIMMLFEDMKRNRAEIEGLKKMMDLVVGGMDKLTTAVERIEKNKGLPKKTEDDEYISYYQQKYK